MVIKAPPKPDQLKRIEFTNTDRKYRLKWDSTDPIHLFLKLSSNVKYLTLSDQFAIDIYKLM
jgi:hypothetical protein